MLAFWLTVGSGHLLLAQTPISQPLLEGRRALAAKHFSEAKADL